MTSTLCQQAGRLYRNFAGLARRYQFRDREEICCHGISVSQCYTLEALSEHGPLTMGELADHLHLKISSMTRIVDRLVEQKLARRVEDAKDRRIRRVRLAPKGQRLISVIQSEMIDVHETVLRSIAPGSRDAVISAMERLLAAFNEREEQCTDRRPM